MYKTWKPLGKGKQPPLPIRCNDLGEAEDEEEEEDSDSDHPCAEFEVAPLDLRPWIPFTDTSVWPQSDIKELKVGVLLDSLSKPCTAADVHRAPQLERSCLSSAQCVTWGTVLRAVNAVISSDKHHTSSSQSRAWRKLWTATIFQHAHDRHKLKYCGIVFFCGVLCAAIIINRFANKRGTMKSNSGAFAMRMDQNPRSACRTCCVVC